MIFSFPFSQLQGFPGGLHWRTWLRIRASFFLHPHLNLEFRFAEQTLKLLIYPASWVRKFTPPTQSQAEGGTLWAGRMSVFWGRPARGPSRVCFPTRRQELQRAPWIVNRASRRSHPIQWTVIQWASLAITNQVSNSKHSDTKGGAQGAKIVGGSWTFLSPPQSVKSQGTELSI